MSQQTLEPALEPAVPDPARADAPPPPPSAGGGVKETIESILVAFILAFVFRAFVVEAFVIPTGSMATTLLGAHTKFHCPDCGYSFDLNYSAPSAGEDEEAPVPANAGPLPKDVKLSCPNCGFRIPDEQTANPAVDYGDRILVLKYLYLVSHPQRWDVVVFKAPPTPTQNYIKRLTGLPGETVMILDGDVYVRPAGDDNPDHFTVQPKPPAVQSAMWRLVYDNDYHPTGQDRSYPWQQPWRVTYGGGPACRQDVDGGRTFAFDAPAAGVKLEYDESAAGASQRPSDYLVYDQNTRRNSLNLRTGVVEQGPLAIPAREPQPQWPAPQDFPVSDLDLRLTYQRAGGTGPFTAALTKRGHTFTAELTPNAVTLYHDHDGHRQVVGRPFALAAGTRPVRVELSNADYQVTVRIDDAVVIQSTAADYAPDLTALVREYDDGYGSRAPAPTIAIRADDQQSRVSHLSLWRDVYYYNHNPVSEPQQGTPRNPQPLGPDEYFTMGDNSQVSWDARCWRDGVHLPAERLDDGPGKVPGRFLLGKAFYVYWPAGHRTTSWLPSLVPDFDGMRMIH